MMRAQKETVGFNPGHRFTGTVPDTAPAKPTLKEAGIDKNLAKRARTAARKTDDQPSQWDARPLRSGHAPTGGSNVVAVLSAVNGNYVVPDRVKFPNH
jgi:hypothetical protein